MKAAQAALEERYDHEALLRWPAKCPIDGGRTRPDWFAHGAARAGFLTCDEGHVLRWDCCGKRGAKRRQRQGRR
jgi:hypothetical protein